MILVAAGLLAGILIALDAQRNLAAGSATTMFRSFSRNQQPRAFWLVFGAKVLLSAALAVLASALIVRNSA
jgi:high-affinity Fe2+/Pb2+ permease